MCFLEQTRNEKELGQSVMENNVGKQWEAKSFREILYADFSSKKTIRNEKELGQSVMENNVGKQWVAKSFSEILYADFSSKMTICCN
jgi:hypothetical protein